MNERIWYSSFGGGSYPTVFHKVVEGDPTRIWSKANSPSAAFNPNLNMPKFDDREQAEAYLDKYYKRYSYE